MINRILKLEDASTESVFLWGARQTGKSTLLNTLFPDARYYDLLKSDVFERLHRRPALLREELMLADEEDLVIIDEVQKIPELLDEVHWLITNKNLRFVLCGSSARKLKRCGANLLGGRAVRNVLYPFVSAELADFDLLRAVNNGMLPRHYQIENPEKRLQAYIGDYLQEEILAEALTRNLNSFSRFLEVAALTDGEILNYQNIATDCGVSATTVKEYFSILSETMIGYVIPAYSKVMKRRLIQTPKFYFFDVGIVNYLTRRRSMLPGSADFGHAFEHLVIQELVAYIGYSNCGHQLSYWRTASGYEVDAILNDAEVAIEIKSCQEVQSRHLRGLKAFKEEHPAARLIVVSLDVNPRVMNGVEIWPATQFLQKLWSGKIV
ncbi:ATP-binding protein [Bacteroides sp.]|uniref:ATP-binding protein n=1 Tax=Bacteroides sp. TaxID=29523 RepID=UPI003AB41E8E